MTTTLEDVHIAAGALLNKLADIEQLIRDYILDIEQEEDLDMAFTFTTSSAAGVYIVPLPRTLRHVELTLTTYVPSNVTAQNIVLLQGNWTVAQAQGLHNAGSGGASAAEIAQAGGSTTVRTYLDGSGYLTIFWTGSIPPGCGTLRVRSLDKTQQRASRT